MFITPGILLAAGAEKCLQDDKYLYFVEGELLVREKLQCVY